ncbi:MAG: FAD-dependent oxidoreductase [Candidatus Avispirillum sp.]
MQYIWIDAVDFSDYGGFAKETQFVREMGMPYLIADGVGKPVNPAATSFEVKQDGCYRFFVRTKNWLCDYAPDGIVLEVDGVKSEHICAKCHTYGWNFEIGADFKLKKGSHTLKVYDTDGWFGRFAAVIITNDYDFTPSPELSRIKKQRNKMKGIVPTVRDMGSFDLIVAGGGVAGVTAAITAARYGLKTALINDRPVLGGNGSNEASVAVEGSAHRGYHETGIIYEIKNVRESEHITWSEAFERFTSAEKLLSVYSDTLVTDADTEDGKITAVHAVNTNTLEEYKFSADYYIDGTGDAWLGYYAGANYPVGREAKFQHNESYAPICADSNTMSGCGTDKVTEFDDTFFGFFATDTGHPVEFKAPDWAFKLPEGNKLGREPDWLDRGQWWLEMPNDYDDLWEAEFVRDAMFRMGAGYFDWLKNSWTNRERAANYELTALGKLNAKRESRRLIGDYIMTENDFDGNVHFPDAVCYSGWNIDVHHVDGIFSGEGGKFTLNKRVPITPIPLRALYSANVENLFMLGRCISVTHIGLGPTRVQLTGATMGQAVATAAFLCKKYGAAPRRVDIDYIDELQQLLLKDGMSIPGVFNHDQLDLARKAQVNADSFTENGVPQNVINGKTRPTDGDNYAWVSEEGLPQSITLKLEKEEAVSEIRVTFDIPFDKYPQCYLPAPKLVGLVTDFYVEIMHNGEWVKVADVRNNVQRLLVLKFDSIKATEIKLTVLSSLDSNRAVVPEIRVYN